MVARRAVAAAAVLVALALPACAAQRPVAGSAAPGGGVQVRAVATAGSTPVAPPIAEPTTVDSAGAPLSAEHAAVVRSVHAALAAGDLAALEDLHVGDDWADQAVLLRRAQVRADVLQVLRTHPVNLGEGYLYPGFTVTGWAEPTDLADGRILGLGPDELPDPAAGYAGWQTAFFLDSAPPAVTSGALQWRGIATLEGPDAAG